MINWLLCKVCFILLVVPFRAAAQTHNAKIQLESIIESIAENMEEETIDIQALEDMEYYFNNPLNINIASQNQLSRLHLLNAIQIQKLLDYRHEFGRVYSIYELNSIDGFNRELLTRMSPFIWFGPEETEVLTLSEQIKYGKHEWLFRSLGTVQKPRGYQKKDDGTIPYEGNRARYYTRYRFRADNNISAGITAEKDPGEAFFSGSNKKGFDFYSGHISLKVSPVIENISIGDFVVRSGQGLVIWQGFSTGKTMYVLDIFKTNQGTRPFTSSNENQFFRGVSTTLNLSGTQLNVFYSRKKNDANLAFSDSCGHYFTSLQTSGYHRTKNEIADKNSVQDINLGLVASKQFNHLKTGVAFIHRQFNFPFIRRDQLYNQFRFQGSNNYVLGANYFYSMGKYQLFGEASVSKSKGKAMLKGAIMHLHDRLQLSTLFRHFDKNYHALWASPFAKGSSAGNETGLYLGTRILPVKFVKLTAYSDVFRSNWINYRTAGPSTGWEFFIQADFCFSEIFEFYVRYKNEKKDRKYRSGARYTNLPEQFHKSRLHFQYTPMKTMKLKTRFEHVFYRGAEKENGFMAFQDLQIAPTCFPINLSTRIAWFDTQSYNSRIYAYENDLLYSFSIPAYFGEGFRTYLNLKYKISGKLEVWFKWANTFLKDAETISSGYNEIEGNKKTEVKFQVRLKL